MSAILAITRKDLKLMVRDKLGLFWILGFPLIYALFFGSIFSGVGGGGGGGNGSGGMTVLAVDEDASEASREFLKALDESSAVTLQSTLPGSDGQSQPPPPLTLDAAQDLVRKGENPAYIRIKPGYGASPFALFAGAGDGKSVLEVGVDPSRSAEKGMLQGLIMEASFKSLRSQFGSPDKMRAQVQKGREEIRTADDLNPAQKLIFDSFMGALDSFLGGIDPDLYAQGPFGAGEKSSSDMNGDAGTAPASAPSSSSMGNIEFVDVTARIDETGKAWPKSSFEISFPQSILWGVLGCAAGFAISLVVERTRGTLLRLRLAPISIRQILMGKALACFTTVCIVVTLLMTLGVLFLKVHIGDYRALLLAVAAIATCFTGIMMLMSVIGKTEASVSGAGWAVNTIFAMLGGGMVPLLFMPQWMQQASVISPVSWSIKALEGAIWRGFTIPEMLTHCAVLAAIGFVTFTLGTIIATRREG